MASLTSLASPKVPFQWSEKCPFAFEAAKALLCSAPVLAAPDFVHPFKLEVDASALGVGAVLLQEDERGIDHPVCYFSKKQSYPKLTCLTEKPKKTKFTGFSLTPYVINRRKTKINQ